MNSTKNTAISVISGALLVMVGFAFLEPAVTSGQVTDNVTITQGVTSGITISDGANITMTSLSTSQNTAVGSTSWTVTTNNAAGYSLTVFASSAPALARGGGGGNIADYTPAVSETPETWSVASGAVEFGFSALGTNVNTTTWGTDADCIAAANVPSTTLKWRDFDLTASSDTIASTSSPTTTSGATTTMCVATEQNGTFAQSGTYTATVTATATSL